jgi:uncharacterized protein (DUF2147 family)
MTKRLTIVAACVAALVASSVTAADAASKHAFTATLKARVLTSSPSVVIYTGVVNAKGLGEGSVVIRVTPAKAANTFNTVSTAFFKNGSLTAKGTNTSTTDPANNATYSGTVKAVTGTGILKGAKGSVKLTGTSPGTDPTYGTFALKGTLTY